jgi:hypothetical protein
MMKNENKKCKMKYMKIKEDYKNGNTTAILLYGIMQTKEFHRGWVFL